MKLRFFYFKKRQKTVVIKKFLEVFRGGKTETKIKELIIIQSKKYRDQLGKTSCKYYGRQLDDSLN
jgi:hypothetical protein